MTKTQIFTIIALIAFVIYEVYLSRTDTSNIRIDLVIFPPILIVLIGVSLYQWFRR